MPGNYEDQLNISEEGIRTNDEGTNITRVLNNTLDVRVAIYKQKVHVLHNKEDIIAVIHLNSLRRTKAAKHLRFEHVSPRAHKLMNLLATRTKLQPKTDTKMERLVFLEAKRLMKILENGHKLLRDHTKHTSRFSRESNEGVSRGR